MKFFGKPLRKGYRGGIIQMEGIPTNGSPLFGQKLLRQAWGSIWDGVISLIYEKLSFIPNNVQNKADDGNDERTKKVQFFMRDHAPHPLFHFLGGESCTGGTVRRFWVSLPGLSAKTILSGFDQMCKFKIRLRCRFFGAGGDFLQPRIAIMAGGVYNGEKSGGVRPLEGSDP